MAVMADKRGPKLGDAASLWNFTPSPGWTTDEAATLKLCLMHLGVGKWKEIQESGLLPGKLTQQLNGQTQRLLGQQSLAAYTGLKVDIDRVRSDNEAKEEGEGVERKGGLVIWAGKNPTRAMRAEWQEAARAAYGLTEEQAAAVAAEFEERVAEAAAGAGRGGGGGGEVGPTGGGGGAGSGPGSAPSLVTADPAPLPRPAKLALLARLHARGAALAAELVAAKVAPGPSVLGGGGGGGRTGPGPATEAAAATAAKDAAVPVEGVAARAPPPPAVEADAAATVAATTAAAAAAPPRAGAADKKKGPATARRPPSSTARRPPSSTASPSKKRKKAPSAAAARRTAAVAQVVAMGFPKAKAAEALTEACGDVGAALEWLCSNCL